MRASFVAALCVLASLTLASAAHAAPAPQPPLDISKLEYAPIGHFKDGAPLPSASTGCDDTMKPLRQGQLFNPSGKWNAFDNNVFEVICYPFRGPGDTKADDPLGNGGAAQHGYCGGTDPSAYGSFAQLAGACPNHQIEWNKYYAETMQEILKDFGVTIHQYTFEVEDPGPVQSNTRFGRGINTAAVVPGADNAEETVIVGAHYDKTNDGPASFWDSQEGHAEMIRMAKLMADYWKATGTRPSATVKFIPWDAEESGTLGSLDYATNNVVPGEESKVRGYFNTDPCAGGYPSYRFGNPLDRLRMGVQLADPGAIGGVSAGDAARITDFNKKAPAIIEQTLDHIDDKVESLAGDIETFISKNEGTSDLGKPGGIAIGTDRPVLFSSDWRNFEVLGIPFFNPGPEVTGPNEESNGDPNFGPDQSADALTVFHTPNDNIETMMRYTGGDLTGTTYSGSYAKGMEFCSHMLAWGMLQHHQVGAQKANGDVVAYYEALPNEAKEDQLVSFDANGSYQYADASKYTKVPASDLEYKWDFGDGETATGIAVKHAYASVGRYQSKLTVTNKKTGKSRTMELPITVTPNDVAPPELTKPPATDDDGTFPLNFDYKGSRSGLKGFSIEESTNASIAIDDRAEALDRWTAEPPTDDTNLQPWQLSDSGTAKAKGNQKVSGQRSFWTGYENGNMPPDGGPSKGASILSLKEPVTLAKGGNVGLSYNSMLVAGPKDTGRVQVAIDDGSTQRLEWINVDSFVNGANDEDQISYAEYAQGGRETSKKWEARFADLTQFAGRRLRVRFLYELGAQDGLLPNVRAGWYVDDIKVVSGNYREIGQTPAKTFTVSGKAKGHYAYRVKAVFTDDVKSSASNAEPVQVTVGAKGTAGGGDGGGGGAGGGQTCASAAAFSRATVTPAGRGLRFGIKVARDAATVDLYRASAGRRAFSNPVRLVTFKKRSKDFTWKGRSGLTRGVYVVRLRARAASGRSDTRKVALRWTGKRFARLAGFETPASCGLLSQFRLSSPVFDATHRLRIAVATTQPATVTVRVLRGRKTVKRFKATKQAANKVGRYLLSGRGLRAAEHRIRVTVKAGKVSATKTLVARRL